MFVFISLLVAGGMRCLVGLYSLDLLLLYTWMFDRRLFQGFCFLAHVYVGVFFGSFADFFVGFCVCAYEVSWPYFVLRFPVVPPKYLLVPRKYRSPEITVLRVLSFRKLLFSAR